MVLKNLNKTTQKSITPELRSFALTLHFYSPNAYNYVRKKFKKCLPHPSTLRKWYSVVDGSPGITQESLTAIKIKSDIMKGEGKILICAMMLDEMCIKEDLHFNGKRDQGFINFGTGTEDCDNLPLATEALVIMLVALNSNWKIPIAYFLINGLSGKEKANIVRMCLESVNETGAVVKTLTFDGATSNVSMATELGANLDLENNFKPFFNHPVTGEEIHIFYDACHMLKLCRNALGEWKILYDNNKKEIKWQFFQDLVSLQNEKELHLATKIRNRHINFYKEKMKVKLAAQVYSASVADAIDYCSKTLKLENFFDSDPTTFFCRMINNIFDFLNTRNFMSLSEFKKPLFKDKESFLNEFVNFSIKYLKGIKTKIWNAKEGTHSFIPMVNSKRKTGFLGFIICLSSTRNLFHDLIKPGKMDFLLTYKTSQDHLEMLFSSIRSRGGFNNNPTVSQFETAYKRLLIHTELTTNDSTNCIAQDLTSILHVSSTTKKSISKNDEESVEIMQAAGISLDDEDYIRFNSFFISDSYCIDVITYIAGAVSKKISKIIKCITCVGALTFNIVRNNALIDQKNRGYLTKPSEDVINICKIAETTFRSYQYKIGTQDNIIHLLSIKTMSKININKYFINLTEHIRGQDPINNHILQMVKMILKVYLTIRIHHYNKRKCEPLVRIRSHLTKTIHFKHQ